MERAPMPAQPPGPSIRPAALAALGALLVAACSGGDPARPDAGRPPWLWWTIGRFEDLILSVSMEQDALYVAAGTGGLFRGGPGPGRWEHLGLEFPELEGGFPLYGVNEVAASGGALLATVRAPATAAVPRIFRLDPGAGAWTASDAGVGPGAIVSLVEFDDALVALTADGGVHRSEDAGRTWRRTGAAAPLDEAVHHSGPGGIYVGGRGADGRPVLLRSTDGGLAWAEVPLPGDLADSETGRIGSIATVLSGGETLLYLAVGGSVHCSRDGGATFAPVLETTATSAVVLVDPTDPARLVVAADRLYYSPDGGSAWKRFDTPYGQALGGAAADWDSKIVAAWEWQPWPQPLVLHSFSLELADASFRD